MPRTYDEDILSIHELVGHLSQGRRPHEVARMLRQVAAELDEAPLVLRPDDEEFLANLPYNTGRPDWLDWSDSAIRPYRSARHALAAGDREAVLGLVEVLFGQSPGGA